MNKNEAEALCEAAGASPETAGALAEMFPKSIEEYTKEDFLDSDKPYEYVYLYKDNKFMQQKLITKMSEQAKRVGVRNFPTLYKAFLAGQPEGSANDVCNYTDFPAQPLALPCGKWQCDFSGVRTLNEYGGVNWACPHPIMPVERLNNIDTGIEKVKIAFRREKGWRTIIVERKTISTTNKITELADYGIAVTSETARNLVNYFYDIEQASGDLIPTRECVTHLGWIDRGEGAEFVPYVQDVVFDGEADYKKRYAAISLKGDYEEWLDFIDRNIRRNPDIIARIVFAASLASVLVKPLFCNCFWLHLWGESESAKTVLMMCAASIWGNPTISQYITTFNSTYVGNEKGAAFCGSLPYMLDELQIVDKKDMDALIYMLTEGAGRSRGNKNGGLDLVPHWKNCTISTGEKPINSGRSNGGAVNRVLECECKNKFFEQPRKAAAFVQQHYGIFGKIFVLTLQKEGMIKHAEELLEKYTEELTSRKITQKQAQSAALILTADALAVELAFDEETQLTVDEIADFLKTKDEVSANPRAYEYVCEQVASNQMHFIPNDRPIDLWGVLDNNGGVYIIKSVFMRLCDEGGFNAVPLLSWLNDRGLIERSAGKNTIAKRIGGVVTRCVHLTLADKDDEDEELPDL